MKKVKVTFWLLGFGCGIALAGIVGTLLTLRVDARMQESSRQENNVNNVGEESRIESQSNMESEKNKENSIDSVLSESIQEDISSNQVVINNKEEHTRDNHLQAIERQEEIIESYCIVHIPNTSSASEICTLLEEAGIVENGKDFLEYIKAHKKQTRLRYGTLNLPNHTDYETLLTLLLT